MKRIFLLLLLFGFIVSPAYAGNVTYQASMTGIECNGCKKSISRSIGKLSGVKTIRISKINDKRHRLTVVTDGTNSLSRSDVTKALGKNAPHYKLASWSRVN
ncbi:MAG: heavy metal-associated domain-containing protein [Verrucomicrobiales bacterium]|nr:heavy metal-associated domain-containing protein [Verrucomicrobiales bacterium]